MAVVVLRIFISKHKLSKNELPHGLFLRRVNSFIYKSLASRNSGPRIPRIPRGLITLMKWLLAIALNNRHYYFYREGGVWQLRRTKVVTKKNVTNFFFSLKERFGEVGLIQDGFEGSIEASSCCSITQTSSGVVGQLISFSKRCASYTHSPKGAMESSRV